MNEEQRKEIRQRFDELDLMPNPDNFTNYKGLFLNEKWIDCNGNAMEDIKDFIIAEVERAYSEGFKNGARCKDKILKGEQALKDLGGEK